MHLQAIGSHSANLDVAFDVGRGAPKGSGHGENNCGPSQCLFHNTSLYMTWSRVRLLTQYMIRGRSRTAGCHGHGSEL